MADPNDMIGPHEAAEAAVYHARTVLGYATATADRVIPTALPGAWAVLVKAGADGGPAPLEYAVTVGSVGGSVRVAQDDIGLSEFFQIRPVLLRRARWARQFDPANRPADGSEAPWLSRPAGPVERPAARALFAAATAGIGGRR